MMPVIRISDATFANLVILRKWLETSTPSETVDRIVQQAMDRLDIERDDEPETASDAGNDGSAHPGSSFSLAFTKPLKASINGKAVRSPRWSSILLTMIEQVKAKGYEGSSLAGQLTIPARVERYEDDGYRYHPHLGISVQGQSAVECWKEVERLAKKFRIPVVVDFWWRKNPKAQYPGKTNQVRSGGA